MSAGTAQSLDDKLADIASALAQGNTKSATNQLQAFINAVIAQAGKKIPRAATTLLSSNARFPIQ